MLELQRRALGSSGIVSAHDRNPFAAIRAREGHIATLEEAVAKAEALGEQRRGEARAAAKHLDAGAVAASSSRPQGQGMLSAA